MLVPVQVQPVARGLASGSTGKGIQPNISTCVTGSYNNGRVCLSLPIIGSVCVTTGGPSISASVRCCASIGWSGASVCCTIPIIGQKCVSI